MITLHTTDKTIRDSGQISDFFLMPAVSFIKLNVKLLNTSTSYHTPNMIKYTLCHLNFCL